MPRICTVCRHPQRAEIDRALLQHGTSFRALASEYGLSKSALFDHARQHVHMHRVSSLPDLRRTWECIPHELALSKAVGRAVVCATPRRWADGWLSVGAYEEHIPLLREYATQFFRFIQERHPSLEGMYFEEYPLSKGTAPALPPQPTRPMRPYVKLYREGDEMAIQTNATSEDEFMNLTSEAMAGLVRDNRLGEDLEFALGFWLPQVVNIACKLRGYKAVDVDEQRVLTAGRIAPSDDALLVTQTAAQNGNGSAVATAP